MILSRLRNTSKFNRNALLLMLLTLVAQSIPVLVSPVLTRLYTPEDFGIFAFYVGIIQILSVLITAKYELAIVLPKRRNHAYQLTILTITITFFLSVILFLIFWILEKEIIHILNNPKLTEYIFLIPANVFLIGLGSSLYYWFNREENYSRMGNSRIIQSGGASVIQVFLGIMSQLEYLGLVLGRILGRFLSVIFMLQRFIKERDDNYRLPVLKFKSLLRVFKSFPKYALPSSMLSEALSYFLLIYLNLFFTQSIAGFYLLVQQVLGVSITIVSGSIGDVFRQVASKSYASGGECRKEFVGTLKKLLSISVIPFTVLFFIAPDFFSFLFGIEWRQAGVYAQILAPKFFLQFIAIPLDNVFIIAKELKMQLYFQIFSFVMMLIAMLAGYFSQDIHVTILFYSIAFSITYIIQIAATWKLAQGK